MMRFSLWALLTLWSLPSFARSDEPASPPVETCSIDAMIDELTHGLRTGSGALKRHLRRLLDENALNLSVAELHRAFDRADDPEVAAALAHAIALRASHDEDGRILAPVLKRAMRDGDDTVRAKIIAGLGGVGFLELAAQADSDFSVARLARDTSPAVRAALVDALARDDADVYSGHGTVVAAATSEVLAEVLKADDPSTDALAIGLLERVSTETTTAAGASTIASALTDDNADVRSAAAHALSGLSPEGQGRSVADLVSAYKTETSVDVRADIIAALARLLRVDAIPWLAALRPIDPRLAPVIDSWIAVLSRGFQEWPVIVRERTRP